MMGEYLQLPGARSKTDLCELLRQLALVVLGDISEAAMDELLAARATKLAQASAAHSITDLLDLDSDEQLLDKDDVKSMQKEKEKKDGFKEQLIEFTEAVRRMRSERASGSAGTAARGSGGQAAARRRAVPEGQISHAAAKALLPEGAFCWASVTADKKAANTTRFAMVNFMGPVTPSWE
jgi:hypothetical protein